MDDGRKTPEAPAPAEHRVAALERAFGERNLIPGGQSRTVLREMGLDLPDAVEIRVWDTTADTRYMVLPAQPPETTGWPEDKLAGIITKEAMIGVARLEAPYRKAKEADDGRHA